MIDASFLKRTLIKKAIHKLKLASYIRVSFFFIKLRICSEEKHERILFAKIFDFILLRLLFLFIQTHYEFVLFKFNTKDIYC